MVAVQPDPAKVALSSKFIATLAPSDSATGTTRIKARTAPSGAVVDSSEATGGDLIRQKGDQSLYWYFLGPTSSWKLLLFVIITGIAVAAEEMGGKSAVYPLIT